MSDRVETLGGPNLHFAQLLTKTKAVIDITGISLRNVLGAMLRLNPIPQAA